MRSCLRDTVCVLRVFTASMCKRIARLGQKTLCQGTNGPLVMLEGTGDPKDADAVGGFLALSTSSCIAFCVAALSAALDLRNASPQPLATGFFLAGAAASPAQPTRRRGKQSYCIHLYSFERVPILGSTDLGVRGILPKWCLGALALKRNVHIAGVQLLVYTIQYSVGQMRVQPVVISWSRGSQRRGTHL